MRTDQTHGGAPRADRQVANRDVAPDSTAPEMHTTPLRNRDNGHFRCTVAKVLAQCLHSASIERISFAGEHHANVSLLHG
jgi:hypothetical protein